MPACRILQEARMRDRSWISPPQEVEQLTASLHWGYGMFLEMIEETTKRLAAKTAQTWNTHTAES